MLSFQASKIPVRVFMFLLVVGTFASCTSTKKINYFSDIRDSALVNLPPVLWHNRIVQVGDMLDVVFSAKEEEAVRPFNRQVSTGAGATENTPGSARSTPTPVSGYKVAADGTIEFPVIGKVPVIGKTLDELRDALYVLVKPYMAEPRIEVKFNVFRVTMLGEVRSPGTFALQGDHPTIFDALAAAGDLPITAKKYNIELYRDYNGQRTITKIDLTKKNILTDDTKFQIRPNDVLYVRTRKGTIFREDFSIFASIATLALTVVTLGLTISNN